MPTHTYISYIVYIYMLCMYVSASLSFLFAYRIFFFCSFSLRVIKFLFSVSLSSVQFALFFCSASSSNALTRGGKTLSSNFASAFFFHCSCVALLSMLHFLLIFRFLFPFWCCLLLLFFAFACAFYLCFLKLQI